MRESIPIEELIIFLHRLERSRDEAVEKMQSSTHGSAKERGWMFSAATYEGLAHYLKLLLAEPDQNGWHYFDAIKRPSIERSYWGVNDDIKLLRHHLQHPLQDKEVH